MHSANERRDLWCCGCGRDVSARLTDGREIYPHRRDLHSLPFWKCDACRNSVGCHHKTKNRTAPLGCIATPEIKRARQHIHALMDPLWQKELIGRRALYKRVAEAMGKSKFHTSGIRTIEEARVVYRHILRIESELDPEVLEA